MPTEHQPRRGRAWPRSVAGSSIPWLGPGSNHKCATAHLLLICPQSLLLFQSLLASSQPQAAQRDAVPRPCQRDAVFPGRHIQPGPASRQSCGAAASPRTQRPAVPEATRRCHSGRCGSLPRRFACVGVRRSRASCPAWSAGRSASRARPSSDADPPLSVCRERRSWLPVEVHEECSWHTPQRHASPYALAPHALAPAAEVRVQIQRKRWTPAPALDNLHVAPAARQPKSLAAHPARWAVSFRALHWLPPSATC